ncbi:neuroligin-1 [Thrips palmi]|uniref:Neuroligin-1 n=1 Tax=Thrips palmi TaxID=161013 RepID=A0A6P8Y4S3_THRPL|nr:neuroligin-1 [Thrips palmi]
MPPVTPSMWKTPRLCDAFSPVCPQRAPSIGNRTEALLEFPRGRLVYLEKLLPLLANQSEDCLYMNIYVPQEADFDSPTLPTVVYVHGESYEWNSGNPYDGSVLAAHGRLIVITLNFRLGILGFLKTGAKSSAQGNFGLMDLVAALHWLRENLPAFGGDPQRVTLMGHGTGAALANVVAVSPVAKELLHRVVLLSGCALSPWALQRDPLAVKRRVAEQTGCHGDLLEDDLAPCLRARPLHQLLAVRLDPPRFLPGFAPFVDGAVLLGAGSTSLGDLGGGAELADFPTRDLMFGLTTTESYLDLSAQDLEFGFNETRRDRILRTYVRNAYLYHLNEIFATLKNEYTDWERPVQNPLSVRDATLEVLSDGQTTAPLLRVGFLHTARARGGTRGGRTYFMHFKHQSGERDFPQRSGSVRGEDIPYVLGLPLVGGRPFFPHNYSGPDAQVSLMLMRYLANFARSGDPNSAMDNVPRAPTENPEDSGLGLGHNMDLEPPPFWDTYDAINQIYLELGTSTKTESHYRGHKMSLWLNLLPQLHRPGLDELNMRHHHFQEEGAQYYDGSVRPQTFQRPVPQVPPPPPPPSTPTTPSEAGGPGAINVETLRPNNNNVNNNILLRKFANSHYQSYTTALSVTIAVGCFLLLLNILIFFGIYHQRDRASNAEKKKKQRKKKEELADSCSSSSADGHHLETKHALAALVDEMPGHGGHGGHGMAGMSGMGLAGMATSPMVDMPLQEFNCSPPPGSKRPIASNAAGYNESSDMGTIGKNFTKDILWLLSKLWLLAGSAAYSFE